jgi:hypothetical protein
LQPLEIDSRYYLKLKLGESRFGNRFLNGLNFDEALPSPDDSGDE